MNNIQHPAKILIVDDIAENISLLSEILKPDAYQISAARDGERAIKIATHIIPDLILLDIMMPGIDGYETCTRLKKQDETKDIPVIFITAKTEIDDLVRGFSVGGVDYINKPFHKEEIIARVNSQIKIRSLHQKLVASELDMHQAMLNYQYQSERLQQIVTLVDNGILEMDVSGHIQLINPAVEKTFGYTANEIYSFNFTQLLAEPFASQYRNILDTDIFEKYLSEKTSICNNSFPERCIDEVMGKRKDGTEFPIELTFRKIPAANNTIYLAVINDITLYKEEEEKLRNLCYVDPLTNLANRRYFEQFLNTEWLHTQRDNKSMAFIMIDIDYFKQYNDTYGHKAGDLCLNNIANSIKNNVKRPCDIVARLGGEEFAVILPDTPEKDVIHLASQLRRDIQSLNIPHKTSSFSVVTISVGIAFSINNEQCQSPEDLYQMADHALYQAKQSGRNQVKIYT